MTTTKQTISILGCGWLGLPLAIALKKQGYRIQGSTTTQEKLPLLREKGIIPFLIDTELEVTEKSDFFRADILIITIPFKRTFSHPNEYKKQIDQILRNVMKFKMIKFIIFTSSTSVYPDYIGLAKEDEVFIPANARARVLLEIEQNLLHHANFKATVIRFGGLYGADRKIGKFLAGQKDLKDGEQPVNLIHSDDCVKIISEIIRQNIQGEVLNACSDEHPKRSELYRVAASSMGLPPPVFEKSDGPTNYKIVSNEKLKKILNYKFIHPNPMKGVEKMPAKSSRETMIFVLNLLICVAGSVLILWFALGLEQKDSPVNGILQWLVNNAWTVILVLTGIGVLSLAPLFKKKKAKT